MLTYMSEFWNVCILHTVFPQIRPAGIIFLMGLHLRVLLECGHYSRAGIIITNFEILKLMPATLMFLVVNTYDTATYHHVIWIIKLYLSRIIKNGFKFCILRMLWSWNKRKCSILETRNLGKKAAGIIGGRVLLNFLCHYCGHY